MPEIIKHNSIIEAQINASQYKPFIDFLKKNLANLPDFIISEKEILDIITNITDFDYKEFLNEFKSIRQFKNFDFLQNPYDSKIFHTVLKGTEISQDYTLDVTRTIAEKGYDTSNVKEIIEWWKNIEKKAKEDVEKMDYYNSTPKIERIKSTNMIINYAAYNPNVQSLDGAYADYIYKDRISGRFYSTPSYDNYSDESNS